MTGTGYFLRDIGGGVKKYAIKKVGATTYYVDGTDGHDTNDGLSWKTAKKTIQSAIDAASSWSSIYIKNNTYNELLKINKANISLIGEGYENTIITSSGKTIEISNETFTYLSNLSITTTSDDEWDSTITYTYPGGFDPLIIRNCIIKSTSNAYAIDWMIGLDLANSYIVYNNIGIYINAASNIADGPDIGYYISRCIIYNCEFNANTTGSGIAVRLWINSENVIIKECNITGGNIGIENKGTSNIIYHNNLLANTTQISDVGSNNIYFENFYSDHTNIDNGFGVCTELYSFTTGSDLRPVPYRNGWNLLSLQRSLLRKNTYGYDTASSVTFNGTNWVDLKSVTVTADTKLTGIKMTTTGTFTGTPKYRILRDNVKVFPYNAENNIESGVLREFNYPINIPINSTYKIQIRSDNAADTTQTIVADEIDKIEVV